MVADPLPTHRPQGVLRPPTVELVDGHGVGQLQHVDLLQLGGGAELRGHDVEGEVADVDHRGVPLTDAGRLHHHQVVAGRPTGPDHRRDRRRDLAAGAPGGQRPEVHLGGGDGVHPDAVPQQGAAAPPPGGVDGQDGDPELVPLVHPEPEDQLVGERGLPGPAGAGDPHHRGTVTGGRLVDRPLEAGVEASGLDGGDGAGQRLDVTQQQVVEDVGGDSGQVGVALLDQEVDHPGQAQALAVLRREDPADTVRLELGDLRGDDHPAATAVDVDVPAPLDPEAVDQVGEVLEVAALVGADGDALHILGDGGRHHLVDRAVVPEVDDLGPLGLEEAAHDVDGGVVTVEQGGGGDEAHRVPGHVQGDAGTRGRGH